MTELQDLERRIDRLERVITKSGLRGGTYFPGSLQVVRCDKDGDGDFDPYVSTSWDGDSFSTGTGTINWNADFGVPPGAKMVFVRVHARDSASTGGDYQIYLKAKVTASESSLVVRCPRSVNDVVGHECGWVPVAPDGTSYYSITASGENTCDIYIRVVAYAR